MSLENKGQKFLISRQDFMEAYDENQQALQEIVENLDLSLPNSQRERAFANEYLDEAVRLRNEIRKIDDASKAQKDKSQYDMHDTYAGS